jgi:hypothetical protein
MIDLFCTGVCSDKLLLFVVSCCILAGFCSAACPCVPPTNPGQICIWIHLRSLCVFAGQVGICSIPTRHTLTKAVAEQTKLPETNSGCVISWFLPLLPDQLLATHLVPSSTLRVRSSILSWSLQPTALGILQRRVKRLARVKKAARMSLDGNWMYSPVFVRCSTASYALWHSKHQRCRRIRFPKTAGCTVVYCSWLLFRSFLNSC